MGRPEGLPRQAVIFGVSQGQGFLGRDTSSFEVVTPSRQFPRISLPWPLTRCHNFWSIPFVEFSATYNVDSPHLTSRAGETGMGYRNDSPPPPPPWASLKSGESE